jgi:hypothetical protein
MSNRGFTLGEKKRVFSNKRNPKAIPNVANMIMVYRRAEFGFSTGT